MWAQIMPDVDSDQLGRWQALLEAQTGINLNQHEHILRNGLSPWLQGLSAGEVELALIRSESQPWQQLGGLVDHLAVKETRFYRNPASYRVLAKYLQGRLLKNTQNRLALDMWSAGCSTGEEAYTMAMVASEMTQSAQQRTYVGVIGSDISSNAVKAARQGCYHVRRLQSLPDTLRGRYMVSDDNLNYRVESQLASRVCFVQSNLLDALATPKSAMDVIFLPECSCVF
ncbi:MAG: type IV pilus assembly protein PilK [Bacteroidia bacterium]|jgi:type IV pilus assembly protein PilK